VLKRLRWLHMSRLSIPEVSITTTCNKMELRPNSAIANRSSMCSTLHQIIHLQQGRVSFPQPSITNRPYLAQATATLCGAQPLLSSLMHSVVYIWVSQNRSQQQNPVVQNIVVQVAVCGALLPVYSADASQSSVLGVCQGVRDRVCLLKVALDLHSEHTQVGHLPLWPPSRTINLGTVKLRAALVPEAVEITNNLECPLHAGVRVPSRKFTTTGRLTLGQKDLLFASLSSFCHGRSQWMMFKLPSHACCSNPPPPGALPRACFQEGQRKSEAIMCLQKAATTRNCIDQAME